MSFSRTLGRIGFGLPSYGGLATAVLLFGAAAPGCGNGGGGSSTTGTAPAVTGSHAFIQLTNGAHPLARREFDRGLLDPEKVITHLSVFFKLSPAQVAERDALIAAQLDPHSPSYHQWLTPEDYAARFGATPEVIERTRAWLAQQGLEVLDTSRTNSRVSFSGRVADLQTAFHTEMRRYEVSGHMHYAMAQSPSVPADLADSILAIYNTHDFFPRSNVRMAPAPDYLSGTNQGLAPTDWANVYDVTPLYNEGIDGTGITIGIGGVAQVGQADIDQFRAKFGLPAMTVTMTLVPNTGPAEPGLQSGYPGAGVEAYLDVEWSGGIAKGATVNYIFTGKDDGNGFDAANYAIENNLTPILSLSFGGCEYGLTPADADVVGVNGSTAELFGMTYMSATGDTGADGCGASAKTQSAQYAGLYVNLPAVFPGVTAVGGTEFPKNSIVYDGTNTAVGYSTQEQVWNSGNNPVTGLGSGGGGISNVWARPTYQSNIPTCSILGSLPTSVNPANMRQIPDVSVNASNGSNPDFILCQLDSAQIMGQTVTDCAVDGTTDTVFAVGGTSAAAPAFAGVVAVIEQATGGGRLGNINPVLYALNASNPTAFHDITVGGNDVVCTPGQDPGCPAGGRYGYLATTGYDCASGLGSIDAYNLATAWAALAPTTTSLAAMPTSTTAGGTVTLTANVNVTTPNASPLSGDVRFNFQSYTPSGLPDLAWTVGATGLTGATVSTGSAVYTGPIPVGQLNPAAQYVDVVAMYGGDAKHMASVSSKVRLTFAPVTFCVVPAYGAVQPNQSIQYTAMGGTPPVKWYTAGDTTCDNMGNCSYLNETTGAFQAGPEPGYVVVVGIDSNGIEQESDVTVGDPTTIVDAGPPPWGDAGVILGGCATSIDGGGPPLDGGQDSGSGPVDSGAPATDSGSPSDASTGSDTGVTPVTEAGTDSGTEDGGMANTTAKAGCGCKIAGTQQSGSLGAIAGLALGLGALVRRRRR